VVGIKEKRSLHKRDDRGRSRWRWVLFVIALGSRLHQQAGIGGLRLAFFMRPHGFAGNRSGVRAYIFFAYIGYRRRGNRRPRRRPRIHSATLPIGMIASLAICTVLYIAGGRACLPGWCTGNRSTLRPRSARAFLDRGLTHGGPISSPWGALAGLTSVMAG